MEVSVESTSSLERKLQVQVPSEQVEGEVNKRLHSVGQRANLKGFRPGKVPMNVVRQHYGPGVRQDVVRELVQSSLADAVQKEELKPAGTPQIDDINANPGANLEYTAVFEVYPEVKAENVENLAVTRLEADIKPAEVDTVIEQLRGQNATYEPVERASRNDDQVTVAFDGSIDGEVFPGGHGENIDLILGSGRMIPGFESGIEGMRVDEQRDIDVTFPEDYPAEHLAGKAVQFHVKVTQVAGKKLPELDAEFIKEFGVESGDMEDFRAKVQENMQRELADTIQIRLKNQLLDQLYETNPIELPTALIESEIQRMRQEMLQQMGVSDPQQAPHLPDEQFEQGARKRVTLGLLVGELIEREEIEADTQSVEQKLKDITAKHAEADQMVRAYRGNADAMRQIQSLVLEDKVTEWLTERANITTEASSFTEMMNLNKAGDQKESA